MYAAAGKTLSFIREKTNGCSVLYPNIFFNAIKRNFQQEKEQKKTISIWKMQKEKKEIQNEGTKTERWAQ